MLKWNSRGLITGAVVGAALLSVAAGYLWWPRPTWTPEDGATLRGLWIGSLEPLAPDPSNVYADNPQAAALGQKLFFDTRLSANGQVACATCHDPHRDFQDGTPLAHGVGTTTRRTMTIIGTAYSPWFFWDGRKDSQWAQALGPLESPVEHGGNRTLYAHLMAQSYRIEYETVFGALPDLSGLPVNAGPVADPAAKAAWESMTLADRIAVTRVYANIGKAIAAYERLLLPGPARFDRYVEAVLRADANTAQTLFTADEVAGLKLFIGRANCLNCHNGPLFTNHDFHNTGVPAANTLPTDEGRLLGVQRVMADEFNCFSAYSDTAPGACTELRFLITDDHDLARQFKPPSLRNVADRAPYMHAGQFATLADVLRHYNTAPAAPEGHTELKPLHLSQREVAQLIAFLKTLSSPVSADPRWLQPPGASDLTGPVSETAGRPSGAHP